MPQFQQRPSSGYEPRRRFIQRTAATAAVAAAGPLLIGAATAQTEKPGVAIVLDPADPLARQAPARWAAEELRDALKARGIPSEIYDSIGKAPEGSLCVVAAGRASALSRRLLAGAGIALADGPEALGFARGTAPGRSVLLATGSDARGLACALLDLADRVSLSDDPVAALAGVGPSVERPANAIRSVARFFVSEAEDKGWFNDRRFWQKYLTMLAAQRFNRFSLTLGIGYDFTTEIRDCYFHFAYPFFLSVPGYRVRAAGLPDQEREPNLEMLRFISGEAARRGLHFQLGLWTHAYQWTNSPRANYTIEGLTPETHAPYCRDALRALLTACPSIGGVTFRVHGESGVAEGSYGFWRIVFDGIVKCGRRVEIDLHAKGMDQPTIDLALATGMPVNISSKYWAEHLGLPYMQASIRPLEVPAPETRDHGFFSKSSGSRKFLRYGYGDLLTEDRKYGVLHRVWPGTQRLLLWGDPVTAAAYGRGFSFCGSAGFELCEPLSFKGRKGGGLPGGRDAYADESLRSPGGGWEKYLYTYRLWGRLTYNPEAEPETWRRLLRRQFGAGAEPAEAALAGASRILPLITTAHCPSAANNNYWPEIYTNMSIPDAGHPGPYGDTMSPKRFGAVSPLDPELFSRMDDFAAELLRGETSGKYSPVEVAAWLEDLAETAKKRLREVEAALPGPKYAEFKRLAVDVEIQAGLGLFFARKFRAGVLYALYEGSGDPTALWKSVEAYRGARAAWAELSVHAPGVYARDITFGYEKQLRGWWPDRLAAIDEDIGELAGPLNPRAAGDHGVFPKVDPKMVEQALRAALSPPGRAGGVISIKLVVAASFRRGEAIVIEAATGLANAESAAASFRLRYRRVNQAEAWRVTEMTGQEGSFTATIPAEYTDSPYPIQFYLDGLDRAGRVRLVPGFNADRSNQPYFVLRQAKQV